MRYLPLLTVAAMLFTSLGVDGKGAEEESGTQAIASDDPRLYFAPYVWKRTGNGKTARAEATMPGAYLRAVVADTSRIDLVIDGTVNAGCPPASMPVIEYSIDQGEFQILPLTRDDAVYATPLAKGLDPEKSHRAEVVFRAADLTADRWRDSKSHLSIAGLRCDAGVQLHECPRRPRLAIGFGDSITEGVGVDGLFTSWQKLGVNNARATWFPLVAAALGCEFGQLGSGGHGIARNTLEVPPLAETWDQYDAGSSRLVDGRLEPEPDYIFCALGTNDFDLNILGPYVHWLTVMRAACPNAHFFCVVPPLGVHRAEIAAAVAARNQAGDRRIHMIETQPLQDSYTAERATQYAYDGVHPSVYGQAMLASLIAVEVQKALNED